MRKKPASRVEDVAKPGSPAIIVVGSLHYDIMIDAPDRPRKGETLMGRNWSPKFGGKGGNQAVAASRYGAATAMVGAVGNDGFGRTLLEGLDRASVDRSSVSIVDSSGSGMSVAIFDDEGDYGAVVVSGANLAIDAKQAVEKLGTGCKVLLLQNEIPEAVNEVAAREARRLGIRTILNAAPARPFSTRLPDLVDILVVNAIEAEMLNSGPVLSLLNAVAAARKLTERFEAVIVTAGGNGLAYCDRSGERLALPAIPIVVASTHGAGDAFVGTLAACLARDEPIAAALRAANEVAARLVATPEDERPRCDPE